MCKRAGFIFLVSVLWVTLKKKEIIAYYVECQNYRETARKFDVSADTVRRMVKNDNQIVQKTTEKNEENTKSVLEAMEERKEKKIRILDKILDAIENKTENIDMFTNIKDLATAYGIILDKEIKSKEITIKNNEVNNQNQIKRIQIINDLPKEEEDG